MKRFLINPNQCQDFGIPICDNPTNQHRPLRSEADFNTHTSISMVGFTCGFISRYSTDDNIETCRHITVSDEQNWYPSKQIFNISSMVEDQRRNVFNIRLINQVRSRTPCAPPVTCIHDEMGIHDLYRSIVNFSIGLSQDIMLDRLIGNIQFFININAYATIKLERHH